jgi:hypothetical protein
MSDVHVSQVKTGKVVNGQEEYRVSFDNQCVCPVLNVVVRCYGLDSAEPIDPKKIQVALGHNCVINDAYPIVKGSPMSFTYAPKTPPQPFPVVNIFPCAAGRRSSCNAWLILIRRYFLVLSRACRQDGNKRYYY